MKNRWPRFWLIALAVGWNALVAMAYTPSAWVYINGAYAYDSAQSAWVYFKPEATTWVVNLSSGRWERFDRSSLAGQSWSFWSSYPYLYCSKSRVWYWFANHSQWCRNMATGVWSQLGTGGDYLVIDLSGGPGASNYPVSYRAKPPPGGWTQEHKTTKLVLRRIPSGTFRMGSPANELGREWDEQPRTVTLTKDYYLGIFPVTQRQWERVMGTWPSYYRNPDYRDTRPVENVSYYEVRENPNNSAYEPNWPQSARVHPDSFMGRLRARTGLSSLDLPTEAQWERACRGGTTTALNSGQNLTGVFECTNLAVLGRYIGNLPSPGSSSSGDVDLSSGTGQVGVFTPNAYGLFDMHGNVYEWCLDWHEDFHAPTRDPKGRDWGVARVIRGGQFKSSSAQCRSAHRFASYALRHSEYGDYIGLRVAHHLP